MGVSAKLRITWAIVILGSVSAAGTRTVPLLSASVHYHDQAIEAVLPFRKSGKPSILPYLIPCPSGSGYSPRRYNDPREAPHAQVHGKPAPARYEREVLSRLLLGLSEAMR